MCLLFHFEVRAKLFSALFKNAKGTLSKYSLCLLAYQSVSYTDTEAGWKIQTVAFEICFALLRLLFCLKFLHIFVLFLSFANWCNTTQISSTVHCSYHWYKLVLVLPLFILKCSPIWWLLERWWIFIFHKNIKCLNVHVCLNGQCCLGGVEALMWNHWQWFAMYWWQGWCHSVLFLVHRAIYFSLPEMSAALLAFLLCFCFARVVRQNLMDI